MDKDVSTTIEQLKKSNELLEEQLRWTVSSLEVIASLTRFQEGITSEYGNSKLLNEASVYINKLIKFEALGFMLVSDEDASFNFINETDSKTISLLSPEIDHLVDNKMFSWAIQQNRVVTTPALSPEHTMVLHVVSSSSKVFGMLVGRLTKESAQHQHLGLDLLSTILSYLARTLDSFSLYRVVQEYNQNLEQKIEERTIELEEAKLRAESSNIAKSAFLANMSHEIRTPLVSIIGYADFLLDSDISEKDREKAISSIIQGGSHLLEIISDILDLSKIEANKIELEIIKVSLPKLIRQVSALIIPQATSKGLDFKVNILNPAPEKIDTDPTRLKQILFNLLGNALKFTHSGHVHLNIDYNAQSNTLLLSVEDTGIGMSSDLSNKIFLPFEQADITTTREFGGTGLGLSLSKQLCELLGGSIRVESHLGKGSTFFVEFSIDQSSDVECFSELSQIDETAEMEREGLQSQADTAYIQYPGKILLVEDTPLLQDLMYTRISKMVPNIDVAANGIEALKLAADTVYDIIFMDIQMPEMDGITATQTLRNNHYDGPIVALTANATDQDRSKCFDAGCNDFLAKPVNTGALKSIIHKYMTKDVNDTKIKKTAPIVSELLHDDPDMQELVDKFIVSLPGFIKNLKTSYKNEQWQEVSEIAHKLKGLGGGYGFPIVTRIATSIQQQLDKDDYPNTAAKIDELNLVIKRIRFKP